MEAHCIHILDAILINDSEPEQATCSIFLKFEKAVLMLIFYYGLMIKKKNVTYA